MDTETTNMDTMVTEQFLEDIKNLIEKNTTEDNETLKILLLNVQSKIVHKISYIHGENLLHWGAAFDNADICEFLITQLNIPVNLENSRSVTPLCYGALKNSINSIKVLLKHYADPRIRNGFSGLFPIDITTDDEIKEMLCEAEENVPIDYDNNYLVKDGRTLVQAYNYRLHRYYISILTGLFLQTNDRYNINKFDGCDSASVALKNSNYDEIENKYKQVFNHYTDNINNDDIHMCLHCQKNNDLKRCSKCKKVYFCNKNCQKNTHELHKFDCK